MSAAESYTLATDALAVNRIMEHPSVASRNEDGANHIDQLPRSLRDIIYDYLWQATPILDPDNSPETKRQSSYQVVYGDVSKTAYNIADGVNLPQCLLTNQAFLDEGLEKLRSAGQWVVALVKIPEQKD